jgi:broad specificity phosphatase PhoE
MAETVVHVVRHGEVHNPGKVLYGRLPGFHLSDNGRQMAKLVAAALAGHDITYLVSSPLERALETAEPLAEQFGLPVDTDDRLLEATNRLQGEQVTMADAKALRNPKYMKYFVNPFKPSWGEPYVEVAKRMSAALDAAREHAAGHEAVMVSHQLPIETLRRYVRGQRLWHDPRRRKCGLASITSIHFDGDRITAVTYQEPAKALVVDKHATGA